MTPLVSIVIPVYNGSNFLDLAIKSALAQTYPYCEILVINDGSTDNGKTEAIAQSYAPKIKYYAKPNGGVGSALNLGIEKMSGSYFSWLSHDDVYLPSKVSEQIDFIIQNNCSSSIVYSNYTLINAQGKKTRECRLPPIQANKMFEHLYLHGSIHGCSLLIPKTKLLEAQGFNEQLKTTQDYDLWMRLSRTTAFYNTNTSLLLSRIHSEQGSRTIAEHQHEKYLFYKTYLTEFCQRGNPKVRRCQAFLARIKNLEYRTAWMSLYS